MASGTFYHGTADSFDAFDYGDGRHTDCADENLDAGVFLTTSATDAEYYADRAAQKTGQEARILTCSLPADVRLLDYEDVADELEEDGIDDSCYELVDYAQEHGFDGIIFTNGGAVNTPGTVLIFDPSIITIQ